MIAKSALDEGLELDSVQSVVKIDNIYHEYSQREISNSLVKFAHPELRKEHYNSQTKPDRYAFAGYVACRVKSLLKHGSIWGENSFPIVVDKLEAIDIDTEEDLKYAQALIDTGFTI